MARFLEHGPVHGGKGKALPPLADIICKRCDTFRKYDCRFLEINPLVAAEEGTVIAAGCCLAVDDRTLFRHPELGVKIGREFLREPADFDLIGCSFKRLIHT